MADLLPPGVIAVFGPTASGKSAVADALRGRIDAELVSCDAMQAYRGLPILTNQPVPPISLVGIWPLDHEGSVGEYQPLAHDVIDRTVAVDRTAVVVGGTGLYLRAALAELELPGPPEPALRRRAEGLYDRLGPERAHTLLFERDRDAAAAIHPNDRRRVVRALELHARGESLSPGRDRLWSVETRHPTIIVGLDVPRDLLAARIAARAEAMFEAGAESEARAALGGKLSVQARQVIGLREIAAGLSRTEAIESITARTRAYARRQRVWQRRIPGLVSVHADRPPDEIADEILEVARSRQHVPARRAGRAGGTAYRGAGTGAL